MVSLLGVCLHDIDSMQSAPLSATRTHALEQRVLRFSLIIVPKQFKGSNRGQKSRKKSTAGGSGDRRRSAVAVRSQGSKTCCGCSGVRFGVNFLNPF